MSLWNKTDVAGSKPKNLSTTEKAATVGVSDAEASANRDKGLRTPGWTTHTAYVDSNGNQRYRNDVLVAISSFSGDAADDAVATDNKITISVHPLSLEKTAPATATFTVTAAVTGGDTLSYQWQRKANGEGNWTNVGTNAATYTTAATTVIGNDKDTYRCKVSATNAVTVNSKIATLTVV